MSTHLASFPGHPGRTQYLAEGTGTDPEAIYRSRRLADVAHPRRVYPLCLAESGGLDPQPLYATELLSREP
jgi:hypothetical protein